MIVTHTQAHIKNKQTNKKYLEREGIGKVFEIEIFVWNAFVKCNDLRKLMMMSSLYMCRRSNFPLSSDNSRVRRKQTNIQVSHEQKTMDSAQFSSNIIVHNELKKFPFRKVIGNRILSKKCKIFFVCLIGGNCYRSTIFLNIFGVS